MEDSFTSTLHYTDAIVKHILTIVSASLGAASSTVITLSSYNMEMTNVKVKQEYCRCQRHKIYRNLMNNLNSK